jgi:aspartate-semialdehyde dehydrogenase
MQKLTISLVGATGIVGSELVKLIENSSIPIEKLHLFASKKSSGSQIFFRNEKITVQELSLTSTSFENFVTSDLVFFAAGKKVSSETIPLLLKKSQAYIIALFTRLSFGRRSLL